MAYFNKICRACLTAKESFKYFLFDNISSNMYSYCTSVEVQQNEDLPKAICEICYELLMKLFDFKQTCIKSQNTLLECNKSLKIESNVWLTIDIDSHTVAGEDEYSKEFDTSDVNTEQAEDGPYNNCVLDSDKREIDNTNELETKNELSCDNTTNKKTSKRLEELASPNLVVVKSVSKTNLSTSKKPKIFSCKLCKSIFSYPERFEAHKLEHEGKEVSIHCAPCDKIFMTWGGLRRHNESEHTRVSLDSLKCRTCGKTSKNKRTLRMHQKTHGERSPCICDICGKTFVSTAVLKGHMETHEENRERKHECDQCYKKFFSNTVLLSHISKCHRDKDEDKIQEIPELTKVLKNQTHCRKRRIDNHFRNSNLFQIQTEKVSEIRSKVYFAL
ncbi:unnamed protein product [Parnassius apollo]|uniref:(apollo) hypothetical protein n=1 Tax=Parnassius apollo TaxID=110799 RepID=A0A8S3WYJ7_PARAO|nr:unnamed protein product [Parnassius apollo]